MINIYRHRIFNLYFFALCSGYQSTTADDITLVADDTNLLAKSPMLVESQQVIFKDLRETIAVDILKQNFARKTKWHRTCSGTEKISLTVFGGF